MNCVTINGESTTIKDIINVARNGYQVKISEDAVKKIQRARDFVDKLVEADKAVYGITTGFGEFSKVSISKEQAGELQRNLESR